MSNFDESKVKRDNSGKFATKEGGDTPAEIKRLAEVLGKVSNKKFGIETAKAKNREFAEKKKVERKFREQLNQVQNGTFDSEFNHLQLGETPKILKEKARLPQLPLVMPYKKAYLSINNDGKYKGKDDHYHGLGVGTLSKLPTALHSPLYIFEHSKPKRIEALVSLKSEKGDSVFTSIAFDTGARVNGKLKNVNVVITAFSPNKNYIERRMSLGKIIYKKKN